MPEEQNHQSTEMLAAGPAEVSLSTVDREKSTLPVRDSRHGDATDATSRVPELFGDYELLSEIARGGMGVVYRARQISLSRVVALKMILSGGTASDHEIQRFRTEAEAAAQLKHAGIVPIHDLGEHDGRHFFTMDFVEGTSLAVVSRQGLLPSQKAAGYVRQIASAVDYAHKRGILHRDLKPSNVLIDHEDQVHVTDFGLAKRIDADSGLTATGQIMGTPSYMPPEQATGRQEQVTALSDVYALGAILYELLTARPPFRGESTLDTLLQVTEMEPVAPRLLNPRIPRDLETICLKCLSKRPEDRYESAGALADDLVRFITGDPIVARPATLTFRARAWIRRNLSRAAVFLGLGIVAGLGLAMPVLLYLFNLETVYAASTAGRGREDSWFFALQAWIMAPKADRELLVGIASAVGVAVFLSIGLVCSRAMNTDELFPNALAGLVTGAVAGVVFFCLAGSTGSVFVFSDRLLRGAAESTASESILLFAGRLYASLPLVIAVTLAGSVLAIAGHCTATSAFAAALGRSHQPFFHLLPSYFETSCSIASVLGVCNIVLFDSLQTILLDVPLRSAGVKSLVLFPILPALAGNLLHWDWKIRWGVYVAYFLVSFNWLFGTLNGQTIDGLLPASGEVIVLRNLPFIRSGHAVEMGLMLLAAILVSWSLIERARAGVKPAAD